jgi:micrococcal nuclease
VRTERKTILIVRYLWFLLLFLPLIACSEGPQSKPEYKCIRVVDGDTIIIRQGTNEPVRVRLIGVDTPESVRPESPVEYFGKEAAAFTRRMARGKEVRLEFDQERYDKYDRLLAYVFLPDGKMLNQEIIRQGYGHVFQKFPFKYRRNFRKLEREARENKRGLWNH